MPGADAAWTRLASAELDALLDPPGTWRPFPDAGDRDAWDERAQRHPRAAAAAVAAAEDLGGDGWPPLPATLAMRFAATGDRASWDGAVAARRRQLATLAAAEAVEGRGRFVDRLIDALWATCEEASWCSPAHYHLAVAPRTAFRPLPPADRELVDIYAANAASTVALAWWLHRDAIAERVDDALAARVRRELRRRVLDPVCGYDDWFWAPGQHNWSVWIAQATATAASLCEIDRIRDRAALARSLELADRYLAGQADDGACDEGPGYWTHGCGSVFLLADLVHARSGGRIDPFADPKLRAMCRFVEEVRLAGEHWFTFADCPPAYRPAAGRIAGMAARFADADLAHLAARALANDAERDDGPSPDLGEWLRHLWWTPVEAPGPQPPRPLARWWPSLGLLLARQKGEDGSGLVCAVKAGSNAEHHNHNDVGTVAVVLDGMPVIVDPGVGTYTRDHFSPARYSLWTQGSDAHAVPKVNGCPQHAATGWGYFAEDGAPFPAAREVLHRGDDRREVVTMDLADCYPRAAGIRRLVRTATFDRDPGTLTVADAVECAEGPCRVELGLPTPCPATATDDGFRLAVGERDLVVRIESDDRVETVVEEIPLEDPKLVAGWGPSLRRLVFRFDARGPACVYRVVFQPVIEGG